MIAGDLPKLESPIHELAHPFQARFLPENVDEFSQAHIPSHATPFIQPLAGDPIQIKCGRFLLQAKLRIHTLSEPIHCELKPLVETHLRFEPQAAPCLSDVGLRMAHITYPGVGVLGFQLAPRDCG